MRALTGLIFLLVICTAEAAEPPLTNQLANNASPYLVMHAEDPVHWQIWNAQTFARAKQENKLLFVSSGYFSCHWCHVMQRESFRDAHIAALINRDFIPVKIDRQLLPAVDDALIDFTERTRGQGGWPLNVFVTPEGYPLLGSLYLPPDEFKQMLQRLTAHWTGNQSSLMAMARSAAETLGGAEQPIESAAKASPTSKELSARLRDAALRYADELQGGFGAQAKFPMSPQLLALMQSYQRSPHPELGDFLRLTLRQMAAHGLQDQLNGGFFRYTTDPDWQTPHFEKMLYDNALLARVYLQAAELLEAPEFLVVAQCTLDFVLANLAAPTGGYYAALSAVDAAGVEGGDYLWDRAELEKLSGEYWPLAQHYWGLDRATPFAAGYLLMPMRTTAQLASEMAMPVADVDKAFASVKTRLLRQRAQRKVPIDTQVLAGWNGLLLWALADAADKFEPGKITGRYGSAAQALQSVLLEQFRINNELVRAHRGTVVESDATLEDYAYVVSGLLRWQAISKDSNGLAQVRQLVEQVWQRFYRADRWRLDEDLGEESLLQWGHGKVAVADGPMPSPPALLLSASQQLGLQTEQTTSAVRMALPRVQESPFDFASYISLYREKR